MTMVLNYLLSKMLISVSLVCPPTLTPMSANAGDPGLTLGSKRSPEKEWQPSPVFLPGELHGQRRLAGYSPWSHKELDTTEPLNMPGMNVPGTLLSTSHISTHLSSTT